MNININIPFQVDNKVWIGNVYSQRKDFDVQRYIINNINISIQNEKEYQISYFIKNKPNRIITKFTTMFVYKTKKEAIEKTRKRRQEIKKENNKFLNRGVKR